LASVRVGVDVGGTNTDAVVMDGRDLLGWAKTPTTADVTGGFVASVREALGVVGPRAFGYDVEYKPLEPGGPLPWTSLS
jgi:N-methylhydantoinase A/oxoprolinase/acetone carboxylase beta subunit